MAFPDPGGSGELVCGRFGVGVVYTFICGAKKALVISWVDYFVSDWGGRCDGCELHDDWGSGSG